MPLHIIQGKYIGNGEFSFITPPNCDWNKAVIKVKDKDGNIIASLDRKDFSVRSIYYIH